MDREAMILQAALRYASCGYKVFPLQKQDKKPLPHSNGFKDGTTESTIITRWFSERYPAYNFGVVTSSEYFVVDIDGKNGGFLAWEELCRTIGMSSNPADNTFTVETGSGNGLHIYFKNPRDDLYINNSASLIGPGIDIRGHGGYVVGAYSTTQQEYKPHGSIDQVTDCPEWLLDVITSEMNRNKSIEKFERERFTGLLPVGARNHNLTSMAGVMRRNGMSQDVMQMGLEALNVTIFEEPLPDREVEQIANSIVRYEPDSSAIKNITRDLPTKLRRNEQGRKIETEYINPFHQDSFLYKWVEFMSRHTDISPTVHEATGLMILSCVSHKYIFKNHIWLDGLRTNLYFLVMQYSGGSKSTSIQYMKAFLRELLEDTAFISVGGSTQGFIQQIASNNGSPCISINDEFDDLLRSGQNNSYNADKKALYKELYEEKEYHYQNKDKMINGQKLQDKMIIEGHHFNTFGLTTDTILDTLHDSDVASGFVGRFTIIWPTYTPDASLALKGGKYYDPKESQEFQSFKMYANKVLSSNVDDIKVQFSDTDWDKLDAFYDECRVIPNVIVNRCRTFAVKFAILIELSMDVPATPVLTVSSHAVDTAIFLAAKYRDYALDFEFSVGGQSEYDRRFVKNVEKAKQIISEVKEISKSDMKKQFRGKQGFEAENIIKYLLDTRFIEEQKIKTGGADLTVYVYIDQDA